MDANEQKQQVQIRAKDEDLKATYSNLINVYHTQEEFVLDFFHVFGQQGIFLHRTVLSPGHLKRMIRALQENLDRYEQRFGTVTPGESPRGEIGFTL